MREIQLPSVQKDGETLNLLGFLINSYDQSPQKRSAHRITSRFELANVQLENSKQHKNTNSKVEEDIIVLELHDTLPILSAKSSRDATF